MGTSFPLWKPTRTETLDAHGGSKIEIIEGGIVHHVPSGGINEEGIREFYHGCVLDAASHLDRWVFFETPTPDANLTPESLQCLVDFYGQLHLHRCVGVIIQAHRSLHRSIGTKLLADLPIPCGFSEHREDLLDLAKGWLVP